MSATQLSPPPTDADTAACPTTQRKLRRPRGPDRRRRATSFWGPLFGPRRRRRGRRAGEDVDIYVDIFNARDVALAALIFLLNIADATFTLVVLEHGGQEANPVMRWLLDLGYQAFLFEKLFVVGLAIIFLVVHKKFWVARVGLWTLLLAYGGVVVYHLWLQGLAPTEMPLGGFDPIGPRMLP